MAPKKKLDDSIAVNLRLEKSVAHRLDALMLARSSPGAIVSRSDVARLALLMGIEALEKEGGEKKPARKPR